MMAILLRSILAFIIGAVANSILPIVSGKLIGVDYSWKQIGTVAGSAAFTALVAYLAKSPIPQPSPPPAAGVVRPATWTKAADAAMKLRTENKEGSNEP